MCVFVYVWQSILELAREWNEFKVSERPFTMTDVTRAVNEGRVSVH
jgi:hypothetical protein